MPQITPIAKTLVGKTQFSPARLAEEKGMEYISARLKDGSSAKIFGNNEEIDCLIMRNGKVLSGKGYKIPNSEESIIREVSIFQKIHDSLINKVEDAKSFVEDLNQLYIRR